MSHTTSARRNRTWDLSLAALVYGFTFWNFSGSLADPDLWGHVRYGLDIIATGSVYLPDTYSYLSGGQKWINHELLSEILFALAFSAWGPAGLVALKTAIGLTIVGGAYHYLRARQGVPSLRAAILVVLTFFLLTQWMVNIRPQLFTYLYFLVTALVIHQAQTRSWSALWALPPLFMLWINTHGGVLAGLGFFLFWYGLRLAQILWNERAFAAVLRRPAAVLHGVALASLAATLITPYGHELIWFLLRTATVPRPEIVEWIPIRIASKHGAAYVCFLLTVWVGMYFSRLRRDPIDVLLLVLLSLLPLLAYRHLPLFALGALVFAGSHIADAWDRLATPSFAKAPHGAVAAPSPVIASANFLVALLLVILSFGDFRCIRISPIIATQPARAVAILKESKIAANTIMHFDWGQYVLWHLGPNIKVSLDGRRETVYSEEIYRENLDLTFGKRKWDKILDRQHPPLALVPTGSAGFNLLQLKPGWTVVYADPLASLFVRSGSPLLAALKDAASSESAKRIPYHGIGLCFP